MRKILLLLSVIPFEATSQDPTKEINEQAWKPFIQTFHSLDANGFLAVHSKDLVRSSRDAKTILNWNEYLQQQRKGNEWSEKNGVSRDPELHFTERIANATQAIEVGIYKTSTVNNKGERRSFFGRFHVCASKRKRHLEDPGRYGFVGREHHL